MNFGMNKADRASEARWKVMQRMGFTGYVALETLVVVCLMLFFDLMVRHIAIFTFDNILPCVVVGMIPAIFRWRRTEQEAGDYPYTFRRPRSEKAPESHASNDTEER
jgi:hypothetical protein